MGVQLIITYNSTNYTFGFILLETSWVKHFLWMFYKKLIIGIHRLVNHSNFSFGVNSTFAIVPLFHFYILSVSFICIWYTYTIKVVTSSFTSSKHLFRHTSFFRNIFLSTHYFNCFTPFFWLKRCSLLQGRVT